MYTPDVDLDPEPILVALRNALRPEVLEEASGDLARVIQAVRDRGKTGELRLKVKVKPHERIPDVVEVAGEVATKIPKPDPIPQQMWTADGGRLFDHDPAQDEIPGIRPVEETDDDPGEVREEETA